MNKKVVVLTGVLALVLGVAVGCFIGCNKSKVAVVNIQRVVNSSEQVQMLKNEQIAKSQ